MLIRTRSLIALALILCFGLACGVPEQEDELVEIQFLPPAGNEGSTLPFSEAVKVGDMLYLSGQIGVLPGTTDVVEGGIQPETRQTLENIKTVLERSGSSMDRVVKCTVFLVDIEEWPRMNEIYRTYFPENPPARSAMAGSGLAFGSRVEIECIAVVD